MKQEHIVLLVAAVALVGIMLPQQTGAFIGRPMITIPEQEMDNPSCSDDCRPQACGTGTVRMATRDYGMWSSQWVHIPTNIGTCCEDNAKLTFDVLRDSRPAQMLMKCSVGVWHGTLV